MSAVGKQIRAVMLDNNDIFKVVRENNQFRYVKCWVGGAPYKMETVRHRVTRLDSDEEVVITGQIVCNTT